MTLVSGTSDVIGGPSLPQTRQIRTEVPGPRSRALLERLREALPAGVGSVLPVFVEAAGGGVIVDADQNSFIDFGSGIAVTSVGNSAPRVVERAEAQLRRFTHTCFLVNPYESYVELCERLNQLAPVAGPARSVLFNTGAEAVENAVKIARAATGRPAVVAFDHAYHGRTPEHAFRTWTTDHLARYMMTKRGLASALRTASTSHEDLTASAYESLIGAVSTLVEANVEAGTVRADLDPETVLRALGGLLYPDPGGDWQSKAANLTDLLWRGMRMPSPR